MNKILLAVLLLAISGKCAAEGLEREVEQAMNAARAKLGQEFNIAGIKGMQWSDKLAKEAKVIGDRCSNGEVSTGGNRVEAIFTLRTLKLKTGHSEPDFFYAIAKKYLNDPGLTEIGFYKTKKGAADTVCQRSEQHWVAVAAPMNGEVKDLGHIPEGQRIALSPSGPSPTGPNTPGSSPDATTSSAMSTPVVFLAIALVFFGL